MNGVGELLDAGLDRFRVMVMPDFFIDRIVKLSSPEVFVGDIEGKLTSGGGSVHDVEQMEIKGGNATNVAYALGRFGVSVNLVAVADDYAEAFLRSRFSNLPNVEIDIVEGKPGYTVSLEFRKGGRVANVMLSDLGDTANVGPEKIPEECWRRVGEVNMVGVFNWAANKKGTELVEKVFAEASRKGVATYLAPADLSVRAEEVAELFSRVGGVLKILSVNENEARVIAKTLSAEGLPEDYGRRDIVRSGETLSKRLRVRVDLHTPFGSASSYAGEVRFAEVFKVVQRISTGAGDVWDAANITSYLLKLEAEKRLKIANAAAALYLSSRIAEPPTAKQVASFLEKRAVD